MRGVMVFLFLFVLSVSGGAAYAVTTHVPTLVIATAVVVFAVVLCGVVYACLTNEHDRGIGLIKDEKDLLENNEIYEIMGVASFPEGASWGTRESSVVILRLRSGEHRACWIDDIPPAKVFKVKRTNMTAPILWYEYPPESLKGKSIDIQA